MLQRIEEMVRRWQEILHLKDWDIEVEFRNHAHKRGAMIQPDFRYKKARIIVFNHHLFVEEYILHELLHLVVGEFMFLLSFFVEDKLTQQEKNLLAISEDQLVEKLTRILLKEVKDNEEHNED